MPEHDIDPEDIESEEDLMFGYKGGSAEPMDLVGDYLPDQEDYAAKTVITKEQVHLLAALEQLTTFYEEVEHHDETIRTWIKAYEKRLTSVHGLSRDEFVQILVAMQGGSVDVKAQRGMLQRVLEANPGDSKTEE